MFEKLTKHLKKKIEKNHTFQMLFTYILMNNIERKKKRYYPQYALKNIL